MDKLENGDLVYIIHFGLGNIRNNTGVEKLHQIKVREEEVSKSGKLTCIINGSKWKHSDIDSVTYKEGFSYNMYSVIAKDEVSLESVLNKVKDSVMANNIKLKEELRKQYETIITGSVDVVEKY